MRLTLLAVACVALGIGPAFGQAAPAPAPSPGASGIDIELELGLGGLVRPAYEGADDYLFHPWPIISLHYLRLPFLGEFGGGPDSGLSFSPSFRVVPERDSDDYSELTGLDDVDAAFELGATIGYRVGIFRGFATLRQGMGGHHGLVGDLGADVIVEATQRLSVSLGPRLGFGSGDYLDTYLGVSAEESLASGLAEYDPSGGIKGVGLAAEARYELTPQWSLVGEAGYERLIGDAADSPIAEAGSVNQFNAGLGLTYRFGLDLYD